jgi:hypothetical protein
MKILMSVFITFMNSYFIYKLIKDIMREKRKFLNLLFLIIQYILGCLKGLFNFCLKNSFIEKLKLTLFFEKKKEFVL